MYDIPEEIRRDPHSVAFGQFIFHWFVDCKALTRGELDLTFLCDLTAKETEVARHLLRRNLGLKHNHIIQGLAELKDTTSVPTLQAMFAAEPDPSRQIVIAGALWKLTKDPVFVDCLNRMKTSGNPLLKSAHFNQIFWFGDERTVDFLIELLDDTDSFVRFQALSALNELEFQRRFMVPEKDLPCVAADYRRRRWDPAFRALMVSNLHQRNGGMKNGR